MGIIDTSVLVIGAGFGGIAMAVELRRAGIHDVVVLEAAGDVGGVWRENTYPGAGCDVPSPLYSFSFAQNPDWPRRYALQPDILAYLRRVARRFGVYNLVRFHSEVTSADFDAETGRWLVRTADGTGYSARVLVPATGQLSRPVYPSVPGVDTFTGTSFHSARWDHGCELSGKRVAVIGTGASAVQFVPFLGQRAASVTVFQRTAPYVLPKRDRVYTERDKAILRAFPVLQKIDRLGFWLYTEFAQQCLSKWRFLSPLFSVQTRRHLRRSVSDPDLRAALTPDHQLGCKRVLFSNDYYPALASSTVDVVTTEVVAVTPTGVRTADGTHHEVDVIVYGTGFAATEFLGSMTVRGLEGRDLSDAWRDGARAHLGITVPGFPNLFLLYGPNTNLGGGSIVHMLESQARYVREAVRWLASHSDHYLDVRPEVEQRWDREVQDRLARSVWTRCRSWYRDAGGRVVSIWPGRTSEYRRHTRALRLADFRLGRVRTPSTTPEPAPVR
ncbi:flavin-containing monooxygenase [Saccharomonospora cyanea]|uniref:Putative flavoprotein involved in K+ transport n=1 Tax=Saccharomonospora cyanea NA-134 TaxID=882082 RepID=H5XKP6_9PSEU|nr:NAD(P)/FAD-dependent oxidoreductase [Saccharomonospora cyanea]EHR60903.1 putative flavoprotein involved in K+ transport [Saccharomonospora cyanea NA-134]